ncbi:MAG: tryptophan-rich sensory protein [Steroidobacteraceae bacterium]
MDRTSMLSRLLVVLATVLMIAVNTLANTRGLGGVTTGAMSARYDLPFTPAGFVFAIWGLIYLGLLGFTLYQAFVASERLAAVRAAYVFTAVANGAWLVFWHHGQLVASQVVMLALLVSLLWIRETLREQPPRSWLERVALDWPMRLYLGWIALATLANLGPVVIYGPSAGLGIDPLGWSLVMVAGVAAWGVSATLRYGDAIPLLVIAWAGWGIAQRGDQDPSMVLAGSGLVAAALAGVLALGLVRLTRGWDIQSAR